jgi:hypothetical protein
VNNRVQVALNYVGTVGKKLEGNLNTNQNNVYYNKELWDALEITREGGDALLFDQMFAGLDLHGAANITGITYGPVGTFSSVNGVQTLNHGSRIYAAMHVFGKSGEWEFLRDCAN